MPVPVPVPWKVELACPLGRAVGLWTIWRMFALLAGAFTFAPPEGEKAWVTRVKISPLEDLGRPQPRVAQWRRQVVR